jgi:protein TonB
MAYLDRTADPNRRSAAIIGVIAVHALIAYLLVTGLVYVQGPRPWHHFGGYPIPLPSPPPPTPTPTPQPSASSSPVPNPVPRPPFPFPTPGPTQPPLDPFPTPGPIPTSGPTTLPTGTPTRTVAFKPKPAVPKNDPRKWVTTDDYPARDLREGNEGTTAFRVVVGTNGRVSVCEIVKSSGHPGLDAATCKAVKARARFTPATDENGQPVAGTYSNKVLWQIPR